MSTDYEIYHLLVQDNDYPGLMIVKKVEFETQETAGEVNFDYRKVMEYEDNPGIDVLGFYHTHPCGHGHMSTTDITTMKAWSVCLGRGLLCLIGTKIMSNDTIRAWICYKNASYPVTAMGIIEEEYSIKLKQPLLEDSRYFIRDQKI